MPEPTAAQLQQIERRYVWFLAAFAALLSLIPFLASFRSAPLGTSYLGFEYNTDDHMVYAAWMRQAMDGHFFFDNRFAIDPQPGLTVHLYFFVLGLLAKLLGIVVAATVARVGFSVLFVFLLHNLVKRFSPNVYVTKLAMTLAVFGGGIGFLVWHNFGVQIVKDSIGASVLKPLTGGGLPVDVWQPESFVFPSMLTNSLFMVSLCLILVTFRCVLDARESWKPVLPGALAFGLLMNIHSYDVLLVALVLVGFLVMTAMRKQATGAWIARAAVIGAGAVPAALWFVHVLQKDPVFQMRADTPTYAANFRPVFVTFFLLIALALAGWALRTSKDDPQVRNRRMGGAGLMGVLFLALYGLATRPYDAGAEYFLTLGGWALVFALSLGALALLSDEEPAWNLFAAWAVIGMTAPYFPALFQRKLAMGLSIPWAVLAAFGFAVATKKLGRSERNLATVLVLIILSGSSIMWLSRELSLLKYNVSNTTVHAPFLNADGQRIVNYLNEHSAGRTVVVAMPGIPDPLIDPGSGQPIPDEYSTPTMPDLNPIVSGFTGVYTYAGHWSETPQYKERRRNLATSIFLAATSDADRQARIKETQANYLIAPVPGAFAALKDPETGLSVLADLTSLGEVVVDGSKFKLIRLAP